MVPRADVQPGRALIDPTRRAGTWLLALVAWLVVGTVDCQAASFQFCDSPTRLSAAQQDRLYRFGALIKNELDASGHRAVLVARSGQDLSLFGDLRYSHAGISLKDSRNTPWSVRQLYFACDDRVAKIFDQGMSGFVLGTDDAALGYVSVLLLPESLERGLARVALDDATALALLGRDYSANAYPFSAEFQNCNQWVIEMLAAAWGMPSPTLGRRESAQRWLKDGGYRPMVFDVNNVVLMWAGAFVPWLHTRDHPPADVAAMRLRVSMPASIEAFVRAAVPGASRIEFCHTDRHMVVHRGWAPVADGCRPGVGDEVVAFD